MRTKFGRWLVAAAAVLAAGAALAHGPVHRHPRSSVHLGVVIGDPWPFPPYMRYPAPVYWPRVYVPPIAPVVVTPPTVYIEQQPAASAGGALEAGFWYYCAESQAYYPYVKECPGGWQKVAPSPAK